MNPMPNDFWVWGYVLDRIPGAAMFVDGPTSCSLESAAGYLGCDNVMWMNSLHDLAALNESQYRHIAGFRRIVCGLTHVETNGPGLGGWQLRYVEAARKIGEFSLAHPNITGALLDDFRAATGPSKDMTAAELRKVCEALKEKNPALKLYLVQYHMQQNPEDLLECRDWFDGISVWCWNSTDHFWNAMYDREITNLRRLFPEKEIIQGQFLHAFGDGGVAMPLDQLELQCRKIAPQLETGAIAGWSVIQNGFFDRESHRRQVEFLHDYWNWFRGTRTVRTAPEAN